jgi:predicted alpha/beta-hydrolase family hydrolase
MDHPFLVTAAAELALRGIASLRYQFPYMEHIAQSGPIRRN